MNVLVRGCHRQKGCSYIVLVLLFAGCLSLNNVEIPPVGSPEAPLWQPTNAIGDARQLALLWEFGIPEDVGDYLTAQMAGLQPAFGDSFTITLQEPGRVVFSASFGNVKNPGKMFWADPRSASGDYTATTLVSAEKSVFHEGMAVVMPKALLTSDRIETLLGRGARVIFEVGDVHRRLTTADSTGVLLLQVTPEALTKVAGLHADSIAELSSGAQYKLPNAIDVEVRMRTYGSTLNALGFIAGQDPHYASQLIVVVIDPGSVEVFSEANSSQWVPAAILLELARKYATGSAHRAFPKRSILVAVGTGASLHAVFTRPIWLRQNIFAILSLGKNGDSYIRVENDDVALRGYSFPHMNEPEATEVYITSVLDEIHNVLLELDGLPLDHEFNGNDNSN
ncbi:MAG: hypothetical protein OXH03_09220 [Bacteroidetes bacterium]|nr:hypothetical protein [Bacteroidota bacterium]MDE2671777.1 hypothetical protein [Bacteroidota bacterium]